MLYSLVAYRTFDSNHKAQEPSRCRDSLHGHHFGVRATVAFDDLDANGMPRGSESLEEALARLIFEFDHRQLELILPTRHPATLTSIAAYLFDRLAQGFKDLESVEVSDERGLCGRVSR